MQLSRLAGDYIRYLGAYKGFSPRTCECYDLTYRQFVAYLTTALGKTDDVRHFTEDEVGAFARYLAEGGMKPNSLHVKLSGLSSLAKYAMRTKDAKGRPYLDTNPVERVEKPQKQRPDRKFLHRDELRALLALTVAHGLTPDELLARDLFVDTGLRVSELSNANVEDVWEDGQGTVVLNASVKGHGRKLEKVAIPLGHDLGERIKDSMLARGLPKGTESLLVNREGRRYTRSTLSEMMARMGRRAGISRVASRPHALRHTYNVVARVEAKLDDVSRAGLLNHTDTSSVKKYDHLMPDETREAREAVRAGMRSYVAE